MTTISADHLARSAVVTFNSHRSTRLCTTWRVNAGGTAVRRAIRGRLKSCLTPAARAAIYPLHPR